MTTFIGTTWQERQPFLDAQDHENKQLADIADRFKLRRKRRNAHIAQLREQLRRLEERENRDWKIWRISMKTLIACYRCGECVIRPAQAKYCLSCANDLVRERSRQYYAEHRVQCREAQHRYYQRKKNNA